MPPAHSGFALDFVHHPASVSRHKLSAAKVLPVNSSSHVLTFPQAVRTVLKQ